MSKLSRPCDFIRDELKQRHWGARQLVIMASLSKPEVDGLINGHLPITLPRARALGHAFGTSSELWLRIQRQCDGQEERQAA